MKCKYCGKQEYDICPDCDVVFPLLKIIPKSAVEKMIRQIAIERLLEGLSL